MLENGISIIIKISLIFEIFTSTTHPSFQFFAKFVYQPTESVVSFAIADFH
jgi:hypothetical protein